MFGRITTLQGGDQEAQVRGVREQVVPRLEQLDGFRGFVLIQPLGGGDVSGLALYESREAMDAAAEIGRELRESVAAGGTPSVTECEVDVLGYRG